MKTTRVLVSILLLVAASAFMIGAYESLHAFLRWFLGWDYYQIVKAESVVFSAIGMILGGIVLSDRGKKWPWEPKR